MPATPLVTLLVMTVDTSRVTLLVMTVDIAQEMLRAMQKAKQTAMLKDMFADTILALRTAVRLYSMQLATTRT